VSARSSLLDAGLRGRRVVRERTPALSSVHRSMEETDRLRELSRATRGPRRVLPADGRMIPRSPGLNPGGPVVEVAVVVEKAGALRSVRERRTIVRFGLISEPLGS
jgi:hypothetical protein